MSHQTGHSLLSKLALPTEIVPVGGVLLHAMVALEARSGACPDLVAGAAYSRDKGRLSVPHRERLLQDKGSRRTNHVEGVATAQAAKAA